MLVLAGRALLVEGNHLEVGCNLAVAEEGLDDIDRVAVLAAAHAILLVVVVGSLDLEVVPEAHSIRRVEVVLVVEDDRRTVAEEDVVAGRSLGSVEGILRMEVDLEEDRMTCSRLS
jgi:hypothetical protein